MVMRPMSIVSSITLAFLTFSPVVKMERSSSSIITHIRKKEKSYNLLLIVLGLLVLVVTPTVWCLVMMRGIVFTAWERISPRLAWTHKDV